MVGEGEQQLGAGVPRRDDRRRALARGRPCAARRLREDAQGERRGAADIHEGDVSRRMLSGGNRLLALRRQLQRLRDRDARVRVRDRLRPLGPSGILGDCRLPQPRDGSDRTHRRLFRLRLWTLRDADTVVVCAQAQSPRRRLREGGVGVEQPDAEELLRMAAARRAPLDGRQEARDLPRPRAARVVREGRGPDRDAPLRMGQGRFVRGAQGRQPEREPRTHGRRQLRPRRGSFRTRSTTASSR